MEVPITQTCIQSKQVHYLRSKRLVQVHTGSIQVAENWRATQQCTHRTPCWGAVLPCSFRSRAIAIH
jgi:hypothetical protein